MAQYCFEDEYSNEKDLVEGLKKKYEVLIFSKTWCPYCKKLKHLFESNNIRYHAIELDEHKNGRNIQDALEELTDQNTVPYTFIKGKFKGGYSDLNAAWANGTLDDWLNGEDTDYRFDLIVIGGGSAGVVAAKDAAKLGKSVAICDWVEPSPKGTKWGLGGTCVNVGCIPKKLMHRASLIGYDIKDAPFFGWELEKPDHDWNIMIKNIQQHIKSLNFSYRKQLREVGVTYYNGFGQLVDKHTVKVTDAAKHTELLEGKAILIATGGRPKYLEGQGIVENCITSDDIFSLSKPPGKTLIVGAGYIALECASFLNSFGCDVKLLVRSVVLSTMDQEMAMKVAKHMESRGVEFSYGSRLTKVEPNGAQFEATIKNGEGISLKESYNTILIAIGREPCTAGIGLEKVGVKLDMITKKIMVNDRDQSSVKNIFALGDVRYGSPELTSVAVKAASMLVKRLYLLKDEFIDYKVIPTAVFTTLEYAYVGETEEHAMQIHGDSVEVYHDIITPIESVLSNRFDIRSFAKVICVKTEGEGEKIIGIHILGPNVGEIIQGYALAMKLGAKKEDLDNIVGVHPTCGENMTGMKITKRSGEDIGVKGC